MCADLVLLANSAAGNKVIDEDRKSRPPKVALNDGLRAETSKVTRERGGMDGVQERGASGRWYIHTAFIVKMSVVKSPVGKGGTWKE